MSRFQTYIQMRSKSLMEENLNTNAAPTGSRTVYTFIHVTKTFPLVMRKTVFKSLAITVKKN